MTDKLIISRKEIEKLQKLSPNSDGTMLLGGEDAYPRYIDLNDLRALLDKAEVSEPVAIPTAPEKIWLNIGDTDLAEIKENNWQWNELSEITWCQDKIDQCDIPYIRADLAYTSPPNQSAKIAELEAEVSRLNAIIDDIKTLDNVFGVDSADNADLERYRWLRDKAGNDILDELKTKITDYTFNEAIDIAMKAK